MPFFCATNTATYTNSCIDALIKTRKLNTYIPQDWFDNQERCE